MKQEYLARAGFKCFEPAMNVWISPSLEVFVFTGIADLICFLAKYGDVPELHCYWKTYKYSNNLFLCLNYLIYKPEQMRAIRDLVLGYCPSVYFNIMTPDILGKNDREFTDTSTSVDMFNKVIKIRDASKYEAILWPEASVEMVLHEQERCWQVFSFLAGGPTGKFRLEGKTSLPVFVHQAVTKILGPVPRPLEAAS